MHILKHQKREKEFLLSVSLKGQIVFEQNMNILCFKNYKIWLLLRSNQKQNKIKTTKMLCSFLFVRESRLRKKYEKLVTLKNGLILVLEFLKNAKIIFNIGIDSS